MSDKTNSIEITKMAVGNPMKLVAPQCTPNDRLHLVPLDGLFPKKSRRRSDQATASAVPAGGFTVEDLHQMLDNIVHSNVKEYLEAVGSNLQAYSLAAQAFERAHHGQRERRKTGRRRSDRAEAS